MNVTNRRIWMWTTLVSALLLVLILWSLSSTLMPIFVTFGLAYAVNPLVNWLEKRGVSRSLSAIAMLLFLFLALVVLLMTVIPFLLREIQDFVRGFPEFLSAALDRLAGFAARFGIELPVDQREWLTWIGTQAAETEVQSLSPVVVYGKRFLTGAGTIVGAVFNILVAPIFFFFFLRDLPQTGAFITHVVPVRHQPKTREFLKKIDGVLAGYIRGQVLVAVILGGIFSLSLTFLGIKFGFVIGFIAGILNLVPYLGQFVGLLLAMTMALVDFEGTWRLLAIPALFAATNFLEGNFISPKIVGERVGIAPVWAIISVIVATHIMGFWGLVLGIPIAGCLKIVLMEILARYRRSDFYRE